MNVVSFSNEVALLVAAKSSTRAFNWFSIHFGCMASFLIDGQIMVKFEFTVKSSWKSFTCSILPIPYQKAFATFVSPSPNRIVSRKMYISLSLSLLLHKGICFPQLVSMSSLGNYDIIWFPQKKNILFNKTKVEIFKKHTLSSSSLG